MFKKRKSSRAKSSEKLTFSEYGGDDDELETPKNGFNMTLLQQTNLCDSNSTNLNSPPPLSPAYSSTRSSTLSSSKYVVNLLTKTVHKLASSFTRSSGSGSVGGRSGNDGAGGFAGVIFETRDRDKKELQRLNDRLADFVEKVRFMEIQNRALSRDVDALKACGSRAADDADKIYKTELAEARKVVDQTDKDTEKLRAEFDRLSQTLSEHRHRFEEIRNKRDVDHDSIEMLMQKLSESECDIIFLRRRIDLFEKEIDRVKTENIWLQNELQRLRRDTDEETMNVIDMKNQNQTILEEIDFLRRVQLENADDLRSSLLREYSPTSIDDSRHLFKTELTSAIREIRNEYESAYARCRSEIESRYKLKVNEIQITSAIVRPDNKVREEEAKKLRMQMFDVRNRYVDAQSKTACLESQLRALSDQIDDDREQQEIALADFEEQSKLVDDERRMLLAELTNLLDKNNTMDAELALYRKLLDSEQC